MWEVGKGDLPRRLPVVAGHDQCRRPDSDYVTTDQGLSNLLNGHPIMADPTTQSNYLEISSQHVTLDWQVDFTLQVISGSATHDLIVGKDGVEEVM